MNDILLLVIDVVLWILYAIQWIILVWVILSWILFFMRNSQFRWRRRQLYAVLDQLNEIFERMTRPLLRPFRRLMRRVDTAGIDWSPMLLLLAIYIIRRVLLLVAARLILPGASM